MAITESAALRPPIPVEDDHLVRRVTGPTGNGD